MEVYDESISSAFNGFNASNDSSKSTICVWTQGLFDERQLRILAGIIALWLGEFGIRYCHEILGMAPQTTEKGMIEIKSGNAIRPDGRIRESGGGRKASYEKQPDILDKIKSIVDRSTYGN